MYLQILSRMSNTVLLLLLPSHMEYVCCWIITHSNGCNKSFRTIWRKVDVSLFVFCFVCFSCLLKIPLFLYSIKKWDTFTFWKCAQGDDNILIIDRTTFFRQIARLNRHHRQRVFKFRLSIPFFFLNITVKKREGISRSNRNWWTNKCDKQNNRYYHICTLYKFWAIVFWSNKNFDAWPVIKIFIHFSLFFLQSI